MNHNLSEYFDISHKITVYLSSGEELTGIPEVFDKDFVILDTVDRRYYLPFPEIRYFWAYKDETAPFSAVGTLSRGASRDPDPLASVSSRVSGKTFIKPYPSSITAKPVREKAVPVNPDAPIRYFTVNTQLSELVSDWKDRAEHENADSEPGQPEFDYPRNRHVIYERYQEDRKTWSSIKSRYLNAVKNGNLKSLSGLAEELKVIAENQPGSPEFCEQAARLKYDAGEIGEAADLYLRAFRIIPQPDLILSAALCFRKAGPVENAALCYAVYFDLMIPENDSGNDEKTGYTMAGLIEKAPDEGYTDFLDCVYLSGSYPLVSEFLTELFRKTSDRPAAYTLLKKTTAYLLLKEKMFENGKEFLKYVSEITDKNIADGIAGPETIAELLSLSFRNCGSRTENLSAFSEMVKEAGHLQELLEKEPDEDSPVFDEKPDSEEEDHAGNKGIYVPENNRVFSFGLIYRWIPYNGGYGFIFDTDLFNPEVPLQEAFNNGRYFSAENVADNDLLKDLRYSGFSSSSTYRKDKDLENYLPVLFIPKEISSENVSTKFTAEHVIPATSLENRIKLALEFRKEGDIEYALNVMTDVLETVPGYGRLSSIYERARDSVFKDADVPSLIEKWTAELDEKMKKEVAEKKEELISAGSGVQTEPMTSEEWYSEGISYLKDNFRTKSPNDLENAEKCFERAREMNPGLSRHQMAEGYLRMARKEYKEAVSSFRKALKINKRNYTCHMLIGECCIRMREFAQALEALDEAIEMRSDYPEAHLKKISVLYLTKRYQDAVSEIQASLVFMPENASLYVWLASSCLRRKEFTKALSAIEKALEISPRDPECLFTQGYIYAQTGRLSEAAAVWDETLALNPDDVKTLSKRAFYLSRYGNEEDAGKAVSMIEKALALGPENPKTWYYRGCVFQNTGNYSEAMRSFEKAYQIDPTVERVIRNKKALEDFLAGDETALKAGDPDDDILEDMSDGSDMNEGRKEMKEHGGGFSPEVTGFLEGLKPAKGNRKRSERRIHTSFRAERIPGTDTRNKKESSGWTIRCFFYR